MWNTIKKILSTQKGKCIVIDSDKTVYLVEKMEQDEEKKEEPKAAEPETVKLQELNRNIDNWRSEEQEKEVESLASESEDVRVEDLPL